ncbi:NUDIX domain-containing protein [Glutamicibacter sp. MNS18]|uniref:8-oxo-dGTP diphosphatase n=1 Tax=Glutamicibacter sp. MNS18 TaxID=2989817 RepID=UPI002235BAFF|nr:NUDIX domain-containing protein [Glutamicibacter sp. MNS18]MCW4466953.1 NUDIX domain-containing protein [Glutamicibacter sp. MNS18]
MNVNPTQPGQQSPQPVVLMLVLRDAGHGTEVLLGLKLTGFGAGNMVAPGGKVEPGEQPVAAAIRELREETGLKADPRTVDFRATVLFRFPANPRSDMDCQVFTAHGFSGQLVPSRELDARWYPVHRMPVEQMWQDAASWLPRIIAGEQFTATVTMADDNQGVRGIDIQSW